ncbi:hypothetical protein I316_07476 [Kwoniella heveanensis BCC8398]|uniref:Calcineurin-like phosphoesterase domain-containing protein n=1 Tax=Kwoniella heveanensis BCC8398 TaxID=1296120 RepID=A0A1B9GIL9_9TREE|nr:hypothetical protein I316_07476 [Kwoniella heveanensis BCC8398]
MLAISLLPLLSLLSLGGLAHALPTTLQKRNNWPPEGSCVVDLQIEQCDDFKCEKEGYHRIDTFLTQREHADSWNYLFYKTEDAISERCITKIKVVDEGGSKPDGDGWDGINPTGGPQIYVQRDPAQQAKGKVVDLVVLRPGRWANSTEDFTREPINLGLGLDAGEVVFEDWREWDAVSSGWVWLEYTVGGSRDPITQVQVVACPTGSDATVCGSDLLGQGFKRRDTNLNGPTANGSHVFLFTSTQPIYEGDVSCVGGLKVVEEARKGQRGVIPVNLNEGTNGTALYLSVVRSSGKVPGSCLTSVIPLDTSRYFSQAHYTPVLLEDGSGTPANLNDGIPSANPIYLYTSTEEDFRAIHKKNTEIKDQLWFNSTGGFRIALYSDLHHSSYAPRCRDVPESIKDTCSDDFSFTFMGTTLDITQPDLVVIDGDLFAENGRASDGVTYPLLTDAAIAKAIHPILQRGLPFAVTWGNHDAEGSLLREDLQRTMDIQPGFVGSRGLNHLDGIGNDKLDIYADAINQPGSAKKHSLWFFDSRSYTYLAENGTASGNYGTVEQSQVDWYAANADSSVNALAFFHIPLGQISDKVGINTTAITGVHGEGVCPQGNGCDDKVNLETPYVPLFDAFLKDGDVRATFSGHDHANDYVIDAQGIKMTYDGSAGYTAYSAGDPNYNREMRVIDITGWGSTASSYKIIDDILQGTVHRNESEPIVTLY